VGEVLKILLSGERRQPPSYSLDIQSGKSGREEKKVTYLVQAMH